MAPPSEDRSDLAWKSRLSFCDGLATLWNDDSATDFKIVCGAQEWKVHRTVLQIHSNVLKAACFGRFKEADEHQLDLSAHDADCVAALLFYCYHFNYRIENLPEQPLLFHVKMAILADHFDIELLHDLALINFHEQFDTSIATEDFIEAGTCAYEACNATTDIRKLMVEKATKSIIVPSGTPEDEEFEFDKVMQACPNMAVDVILALKRQRTLQKTPTSDQIVQCSGCTGGVVWTVLDSNRVHKYCHYCAIKRFGEGQTES